MAVISRAFELRYLTGDPRADGETDFKGPTEIFDTEERVAYLRHYADYAARFFGDPGLDTPVVAEREVAAALARLKPRPLPEVRRRLPLRTWRAAGARPGQRPASRRRLEAWNALAGVEAGGGLLRAVDPAVTVTRPFRRPQTWRFRLAWRFRPAPGGPGRRFTLEGKSPRHPVAAAGCDSRGRVFFTSLGRERESGVRLSAGWHELAFEVDLLERRYNFLVDGRPAADFVPLEDPGVSLAGAFRFEIGAGDALADLFGTGFRPLEEAPDETPFDMHIFMDEDFRLKPALEGWAGRGYDDAAWEEVELPHPHGGLRYAGEDLLLRHAVRPGAFTRAILHLETIDPGGEVLVNGKTAARVTNREPVALDVSALLRPHTLNILAIRVRAQSIPPGERGKHAPTDPHIGWFAGRAWLDLCAAARIEDVFAWTVSLADPAQLQTRVEIENGGAEKFSGRLQLRLYPWYPRESKTVAAAAEIPFSLASGAGTRLETRLEVPSPRPWHWRRPRLYRLRAILRDHAGKAVDDEVITIGLRTVSQEGGLFRLNGEPELLRAPLFFGERPPIEEIARRHRCAPGERIVREMLMVRKMNGNGGRMSVHHANVLGINDPRFAEYADQLGFLWIWAPTPWVRQGPVGASDWSGLGRYIRQVRNHPSIVIWQTANHPDFKGSFAAAVPFFKLVYETIYPLDPSRLISPVADYRRLGPLPSDDGTVDSRGRPGTVDPVWTAPMMTRGSMDTPTGYGRDWSVLRLWPRPRQWLGGVFQPGFLASGERAYFNFEHEETTGMPNWDTCRGKPYYRLYSYERYSDVIGKDDAGGRRVPGGSIGRFLALDEWRESQAWQAFSAFEAIRKMRWLGYDGLCWCCLHGGGNNATYMKPLVDYHGNAKLAFHANRMAFQEVLAGSGNVDIAYGPGDRVPVTVLNLGKAKRVEVRLAVRRLDGTVVAGRRWRDVRLPAGRSATALPAFRPPPAGADFFVFEYTVVPSRASARKHSRRKQ